MNTAISAKLQSEGNNLQNALVCLKAEPLKPLVLVLLAMSCLVTSAKAQTTVLSEGFEGAFPGSWSVGDANTSGTPAYWDDVGSTFGGETPRSGSWKGYCAGVGYAGTTTSPTYRDYMSAYMSRSINLSGFSSATLSFWYKIPSIESGNYDKLRVYIGSTIIWERSTAQTAWTNVTLSLNSYVGSSRTLKFEFYSDGSGTAEGAYLDDILVTATATTCTDDGYEQDDTAGTAKTIACGTTQSRAICPGDVDWATFTLSGSNRVVITTGARSGYSGGDTVLYLYGPNSSTTQIAYNDDFNGLWSQITANLGAGTYYIRVEELGNNAAIPGYTLSLSCTPIVTCGSDSYESDNTAGTAKTIACGTTQSRAICPVGDVDWATFTLSGSNTVVITTGARSGYSGGDTVLYLFGPNSSTTQIAYNDDFNGLWSQITANLGAGTYYIRVEELGNNGAIPGYTLSLSCTPIVTCGSDSYEADNTAGTAKTITDGQTQNRSLCPAPDADWAVFTMSGPGNALIRTGARSGYTGGDTVMWLYGPNSFTTQIAYNDDANGTLWSQIQANNLSAGTYYIRVEEYGNNDPIPGYTLFLDTTIVTQGDAYEPDDSAGTAKAIADAETQNRSIHVAGNEDWARFTVGTAGSAVLLRTGPRSGYAGGDTVMWLYGPNSSTTPIAYNDDYNGLWSQITVSNLAVGPYYVRLQEYGNNGTIDGYTLFLDVIPPTSPCAGVGSDSYEPDDTAGTAKTISDGETQNRAICPAGNEDWARFTVTSGSAVLLRTGARSGYAGGDTVMWLYGPNNSTAQIGYNDDFGGTLWSQITVSNLAGGTYYVRLQEYGNNGTIPGYTLFLDIIPLPVTCADSYEPDDSAGAAKTIADGETQNRSICPAANEDWVRVTLSGPSSVLLRTGPRSGLAGGDTVMWLYGPNSSTTQIAYNDDFGGTLWSQITVPNLPAGTYYVRIQEYGNNGTIAGYTLFFDATAIVITGDAYEPDDSAGAAKVIADNQTQNRSIHAAGNEDWARFTLTGPSDVLLRTGPRSGLAGGDTVMWLYGPNTSTTQVPGGYNDDFNGLWSQISMQNLPAGTYYVRIQEYGNNGTIDGYTLYLDVTPVAVPPQPNEPNDTSGSATPISFGASQVHSIVPAGDVDWMTFTLSTASEVVLVTSGASGDTLMYLYGPNSATTLIESDDDDGPGNFSRIERRGASALQAGTYYVKVQAFSSSQTIAAYTLSLRVGNNMTGFFMGRRDAQGNRVSGDSFAVTNTLGTCAGMSAYSKWYFETHAASSGPLYPHFTTPQQDQIAQQAQSDVSGIPLISLLSGDYTVAENLKGRLDTQNLPQLLFMGKNQFSGSIWEWLNIIALFRTGDAHMVLVVGYSESGSAGTFTIYNNWFTDAGNESTLSYSSGTLSNFSDDAGYIEFEDVQASSIYNATTFTTGNYPAP